VTQKCPLSLLILTTKAGIFYLFILNGFWSKNIPLNSEEVPGLYLRLAFKQLFEFILNETWAKNIPLNSDKNG
jgi:hypothetical protein